MSTLWDGIESVWHWWAVGHNPISGVVTPYYPTLNRSFDEWSDVMPTSMFESDFCRTPMPTKLYPRPIDLPKRRTEIAIWPNLKR